MTMRGIATSVVSWGAVVGAGVVVLFAGGPFGMAQNGGDGKSKKSSKEAPDVDYVALAGKLVRDGHYDRAKTELEKVDPSAEDVDRPLYYTLRGLVALHDGEHEAAVQHFDDAIRYGQTDDRIFVHLAQAYYGLGNWEKVIQSVRNSAEKGEEIPDLHLMKAEAERKLGRLPDAWSTLEEGRQQFPDRPKFLRQQVFLLVEMELYQAALQRGRRYLRETEEAEAKDYIAISQAFRRAGEHRRAQVLLESARSQFPQNGDVLVHLAHAYIGDGKLVAGAELLQVAAEWDAKYIEKSAELFRRAGAYQRAMFMNSRIGDQEAKFKQRVAILLEKRDYERIGTLDARLSRLGLLQKPKVAYALAYAHFKVRNYERAAELTGRIEGDMFDSAVELRGAIEKCRAAPWKC